jgi:hypothetical protein
MVKILVTHALFMSGKWNLFRFGAYPFGNEECEEVISFMGLVMNLWV